jgi:hypothetical protein
MIVDNPNNKNIIRSDEAVLLHMERHIVFV